MNTKQKDLKKPMKAPADAIAREMTEAEENRAMDFILKGSKIVIGEGRQPNQPK